MASKKQRKNPFTRDRGVIDNAASTSVTEKDKDQWKYSGERSGETYHGQGRLQHVSLDWYYEGENYKGEWLADKMHGTGTIVYPNGDCFEGQWEDGKRVHGTLTIPMPNTPDMPNKKMEYRGLFTNSMPGPVGELVWEKAGRYYGAVNFTVLGRYTVPTYKVYREGYGEMYVTETTEKYIGDWRNDLRKHFGISIIQSTGERYHGNWKKGKKSGHGVTLFSDGTWYEGVHSGDGRKGKGKMWLPNGDCLGGDWAGDKVTSATFHKGSFDDVPRPIKGIAVANITKTQKSEDKMLFMTCDKWQGLASQTLHTIPVVVPQAREMAMALSDKNNPSKELATLGLEDVSEVLDKFIYIINWDYGNTSVTSSPSSSANAKFLAYNLQCAVDDINSFLSCMTQHLSNSFEMNFSDTKLVYESLMTYIFPQVYPVLFPMYQRKLKDALLQAKMLELKNATVELIGVKPKFRLDNTVTARVGTSREKHQQCYQQQPEQEEREKDRGKEELVSTTSGLSRGLPFNGATSASPKESLLSAFDSLSADDSTDTQSSSTTDTHFGSETFPQRPKGSAPIRGTLDTSSYRRGTIELGVRSNNPANPMYSPDSSEPLRPALPVPLVPTRVRTTTQPPPNTTPVSRPLGILTSTAPEAPRNAIATSASPPSPLSGSARRKTSLGALRWPGDVSPTAAALPPMPPAPTAPKSETGKDKSTSTSSSDSSDEGATLTPVFSVKSFKSFPVRNLNSSDPNASAQLKKSSDDLNDPWLQKDSKVCSKPEPPAKPQKPTRASLSATPTTTSSNTTQSTSPPAMTSSKQPTSPTTNRQQSHISDVAQSKWVPVDRNDDTEDSRENLSSSSSGITPNTSSDTKQPGSRNRVRAFPIHNTKPYSRVCMLLESLEKCTTPLSKVAILSKASSQILQCVDEYYHDKTEQIAMGAEDKFPVLIFALVQSGISSLFSQATFLLDFVNEYVGHDEAKYRVTEFHDALKYIMILDWQVRDQSNTLIPIKMIISTVVWASKAVERLKFPSTVVNPEAMRIQIILSVSYLFREISQRIENPYEPLPIRAQYANYITHYRDFYESVFCHEQARTALDYF